MITPGSDLSIAAQGGDIAIAVLGGQPPGPATPTLYFASKSGGWSKHGVAGGGENNGTIGSPSLVLDSLGRPRIAFQRNGAMKFAVASSPTGNFTIEKVATVSGSVTPSLALDDHERPMIVWAAASGTFYARRNAGLWYASRVMPGHLEARLTIDSHGAHVATADRDQRGLVRDGDEQRELDLPPRCGREGATTRRDRRRRWSGRHRLRARPGEPARLVDAEGQLERRDDANARKPSSG